MGEVADEVWCRGGEVIEFVQELFGYHSGAFEWLFREDEKTELTLRPNTAVAFFFGIIFKLIVHS